MLSRVKNSSMQVYKCIIGIATRVPENPSKPGSLQTRKPGFESGQKPGFTGLILGVNQYAYAV